MAEPQDPYFLYPSNHPRLVLVTQPLTKLNYMSWARAMKMALNGKWKMCFIDGSLPRPDSNATPEMIAAWDYNNDIVLSWILNCISKESAKSAIFADSTATLWKNLKERSGQANGPRLFQLKKAMMNLSQGLSSVNQCFSKLKMIWDGHIK